MSPCFFYIQKHEFIHWGKMRYPCLILPRPRGKTRLLHEMSSCLITPKLKLLAKVLMFLNIVHVWQYHKKLFHLALRGSYDVQIQFSLRYLVLPHFPLQHLNTPHWKHKFTRANKFSTNANFFSKADGPQFVRQCSPSSIQECLDPTYMKEFV